MLFRAQTKCLSGSAFPSNKRKQSDLKAYKKKGKKAERLQI
jgi:hypothetical protein